MIKRFQTNFKLVTLALILSLALTPSSFAEKGSIDSKVNKKRNAEKIEQKQTAEKRKEVLSEATSAISKTKEALKKLDEKKTKEALAALENATGKLQIILAREPELALAPANVTSTTHDVFSNIAAINVIRDKAEDALEDGRLQEARRLIRNLASEIVISVSNIPLATYPDAIQLAAKLIDENKLEEAKAVLQKALNTLVVTEIIIPLPVVYAEHNLKEAEALAEKTKRNKEEDERLAALLKSARRELEFAKALGYSSKKNFEKLYEQIDLIENKTKGGKTEKGLFSKIKNFLKDVVKTTQSEQPSDEKV